MSTTGMGNRKLTPQDRSAILKVCGFSGLLVLGFCLSTVTHCFEYPPRRFHWDNHVVGPLTILIALFGLVYLGRKHARIVAIAVMATALLYVVAAAVSVLLDHP